MQIAYTFNRQTAKDEAQAEFDTPETIALLEGALRKLGHQVTSIDVGRGVRELVSALHEARPDLVFNTAEGGSGRAREAFYPALFDALGLAYTGSDAYVCTVTLDKQLTKDVLRRHGVPMAASRLVVAGDPLIRLDLRFPVIVKPNFEGSSMGITERSVVESEAELPEVLADALARFPAGVVVEEFIVGRDVVVPFLAAASPATGGVLEPAEYVYKQPGRYGIFDLARKMRGFDDVEVRAPARLDEAQRRRAIALSQTAVRALGVRDLGRIDYRLAGDGELYFLEMNAIPSLEPGASIYLSGRLAGLSDTAAVLGAVIAGARARFPSLAGVR